jgi:hypothetical protein
MNVQRCFLLMVIVAASAAMPALGQTVGPAAVPDFSGIWWHPSLPGFEPPASGPGPVTNRSRRVMRGDAAQSAIRRVLSIGAEGLAGRKS